MKEYSKNAENHILDSLMTVLELHRAGFEPATFGSVDRSDADITPHQSPTYKPQELDMSSCMSFLKQNEPGLHQIVSAWPALPDHIKATIQTLIESAGVSNDASE